ncbi:MAG: hypothetical protein R3350_07760 [Saprospiraceae bacterium]|nr:hypothetical protein [Saprospiraceae bacterium]
MAQTNLRRILILLLIGLLTIAVAVLPDIIAPELEAWGRETLGQNYKLYFIALFVVASFILVFLGGGFPGKKPKQPGKIKIPWNEEHLRLIREARQATGNARLEIALENLSKIESPALEEPLQLLSTRLANFERETMAGIQTEEQQSVTFNRLSREILRLIRAVEDGLKEVKRSNEELRDYLRDKYKKRLGQKLAGRKAVNLRRLSSSEGTSENAAAAFIAYSRGEISGEIEDIFRDAHGRLLIVGEPGSGKTSLLLQLELALLETETDALPVVLNLSTWKSSFLQMEAWLERILPVELGINTGFTRELLHQARIIPLFDGLDEVPKNERASCLEAIGRYGADARRQYVISSRIEEYKSVDRDAPVHMQIEVGGLTFSQIETELTRIGYQQPEALPLLQAIRQDKTLREVAQKPFFFNALQLLFAKGKRLSDLKFTADTVEGRQKEILQHFITGELADAKYGPKLAADWLSYFAIQMTRHGLGVFELKDLQYSWGSWSSFQSVLAWRVHNLVVGLVKGLESGLFTGLLIGLVYSAHWGLIAGLVVAVLAIISSDQGFESVTDRDPPERKNGAFRTFFRMINKDALAIMNHVLFFSLPAGVVVGIYLPATDPIPGNGYNLVLGIGLGLVSAILSGLLFGYIIGLIYGLIEELYWYIRKGRVEERIKRYEMELPEIKTRENLSWSWQRFLTVLKNSWKGLLFISIVFGLFIGYIDGWARGLMAVLSYSFLFVIAAGIFGGISITGLIKINRPYQRFTASMRFLYLSILQHWLLRLQLYSKGLLPLRLVVFLEDMARCHLIESDGASWRFRHRFIQEYFSKK